MEGWIKLHRRITEWEWYTDTKTKSLFFHLLLVANHKEGKFRGSVVPKGSLITGLKALSAKTGLSVQSLRTSLNKLKLTGEITIQSTNLFSIITIVNWNNYQDTNTPDNKPLTNDQQTTNNKQECNNNKNEKEDKKLGRVASKPIELFLKDWMERNGIEDIPKEWGDFAYHELFIQPADINLEWDKFKDYWFAKGGAKGKKADWLATWRNWCSTSIQYKSERSK